jgi:hypothetical protein
MRTTPNDVNRSRPPSVVTRLVAAAPVRPSSPLPLSRATGCTYELVVETVGPHPQFDHPDHECGGTDHCRDCRHSCASINSVTFCID